MTSEQFAQEMMKALLSLTLLLAVALCALPVHAEEALPPLSDLFLYEPGEGEENAEATRAANAAYREMIDALAQKTDVVDGKTGYCFHISVFIINLLVMNGGKCGLPRMNGRQWCSRSWCIVPNDCRHPECR